jgi:hypothetical protein
VLLFCPPPKRFAAFDSRLDGPLSLADDSALCRLLGSYF